MTDGLLLRDLTIVHADFTATYDLALPRGAFCGLIGPSGGGKTTLLNAIAGFETPARGTLTFEGQDLLPLEPAARPVTILFQENNLFEHLSAFQNVALGLRPDLKLTEAQRDAVAAALDKVGLKGKEARRPGHLSGGERQRVAIARALVRQRPLWLMDEPFGALDPGLRREMIALIEAMRREQGASVLLSLHTPADMLGHADCAAFIAEGRVALVDAPEALLAGGRGAALDAYLGRDGGSA